MTEDRTRGALQTIFSFFLGLMVVAFVGVGVNTFYTSPEEIYQPVRTAIERQMSKLNIKSPDGMTASERAELERLQEQQNALQDKVDAAMRVWARNTSIVLVVLATVAMGVSLIRSDQLRVISNGLLLGGLFTMLYGVGWVIFSGSSTARFAVILVAFVITLGLGYLRFVRDRAGAATAGAVAAPAAAGAVVALPQDVGELESRVAALESKMNGVASVLSGPPRVSSE